MTNLEINIHVRAPELAAAITKLADSLAGKNATANQPTPELSPAARAMQQLAAQNAPMTATQQPVPTAIPTATAPQPMPAATTATPAPSPVQQYAPVTAPAAYTMEQLMSAAGERVQAGKQPELVALLGKYGVQAMAQLAQGQYDAFAADLRAMGARI